MKTKLLLLLFAIYGIANSQTTPSWNWAKKGGGSGTDLGQSAATDNSGNIYVTGYFNSPSITFGATTLTNKDNSGNTYDIYLVKYDANGNVLWAKSAGGSTCPGFYNDYAYSVSVNSNGSGIYVVGSFIGCNIVFGSTILNHSSLGIGSSANVYIVKYDASGNVVWAQQPVGNHVGEATAVKADGTGSIYVTGHFDGANIVFGSTTLTNLSSFPNADIFTVKYNSSGSVLWAKRNGDSGDEKATSVTTDASSNIYIAGYFNSPNMDGLITNANSSGTTYDMFLIKYNSSGSLVGETSAGGSSDDFSQGVSTDASGNIFATGYFNSSSITFGSTNLTNAGSSDIFIVKYDAIFNVLWAKKAGGSGGDYAYSIINDGSGNVYTSGFFGSSTITFGSTTLTNSGIFVVKYDGAGNALWAKDAVGGGYGTSICTDASANIFVAGYFGSTPITFGSTTLTNSGGADVFTVKIAECNFSQPTITASGSTTFCQGNSVTLSANSANSYSWNTGATTSSIPVSSSGSYSVTLTDAGGCSATSIGKNVTVNALPTATISASSPTTFCQGGSVSLTATNGMSSYSWSTGASTSTINVSTSGNYSVTVTNSNGCSATSSGTNVTVNPNPTATISNTINENCFGGNNGSATISASGGTSPYSYSWTNGQTTTTATNLISGNYSVTVTDSKGCATTQTVNISQPSALTSTISATSPTCNGGNDGSASVNASGATSPYTYLWNNSATTQNISGLIAGNYSVTITDANGCTKTSTITVTQPNPVSVNITPASPSICNGSSVTLSAGFGYSSYSWSTGQTSASINVSPTTTSSYSIIVSDVNGCTGSTSTTVTVKPVPPTPTVFVNGNTTFCQGDSSQLIAPVGYSSYLWSPSGQSITSITVSAAGNYFVTVSNVQGCTASSAATNIQVNALPSATLSVTAPTCGNNNGSVTASVGNGNPPYTFSWNTGETTATVTGLTGSPTQTLIVTITDSNNCSSQATALVNCVTGINNYDSQNQISISPNPSTGIFIIQSSNKISNIEISNLIGEKIYSSVLYSNKSEIDLTKQPQGIYFIKINSEKGTDTKKIIIQ